MGLRRRLLSLVSLASLAILVYGGVSFGFSVPVTAETAEANVAPLGGVPEGARAVVVPVTDAGLVPTLRDGSDTFLGYHGAMLAHGAPGRFFPAAADDVQLGRALMFLSANESRPTQNVTQDRSSDGNRTNESGALNESTGANASAWLVQLSGVPMPHALSADGTDNLTLDLDALYDGRAGFIVKPDHVADATFVPLDDVVGEVIRFDAASRTQLLLVSGATGFLAPLVLLGVMRRQLGPEDAGSDDACHECRSPLQPMHSFCLRCGALREDPST